MQNPPQANVPTRRDLIAGLPVAGLAAGGLASVLGLAQAAAQNQGQGGGQGRRQGGGQGGGGGGQMPQKLMRILGGMHDGNAFTLPELPYDYGALEPTIDRVTMELHHSKHHQGYVDGLNSAVKRMGEEDDATAMGGLARNLSFNYGGHILHSFFWAVMGPGEGGQMGGEPSGELAGAIERDFGSFDDFKKQWSATAGTVKGSGWVALVFDPVGVRLHLSAIGDHDRFVLPGTMPLMPLDIWEHAYYLTYQNRRGEYVEKFLDVVDWSVVNAIYQMVSAPYSRG